VEEAVRMIKGLPGVRFVFNYVTVMITPQYCAAKASGY